MRKSRDRFLAGAGRRLLGRRARTSRRRPRQRRAGPAQLTRSPAFDAGLARRARTTSWSRSAALLRFAPRATPRRSSGWRSSVEGSELEIEHRDATAWSRAATAAAPPSMSPCRRCARRRSAARATCGSTVSRARASMPRSAARATWRSPRSRRAETELLDRRLGQRSAPPAPPSAADLSVAGSGDLELGGLRAQTADVSIAGSGNIALWAQRAVDGSVVGSGDVTISGAGALPGLQDRLGRRQLRRLRPVRH